MGRSPRANKKPENDGRKGVGVSGPRREWAVNPLRKGGSAQRCTERIVCLPLADKNDVEGKSPKRELGGVVVGGPNRGCRVREEATLSRSRETVPLSEMLTLGSKRDWGSGSPLTCSLASLCLGQLERDLGLRFCR